MQVFSFKLHWNEAVTDLLLSYIGSRAGVFACMSASTYVDISPVLSAKFKLLIVISLPWGCDLAHLCPAV